MSLRACLIQSDLSAARCALDGTTVFWEAAPAEDDGPSGLFETAQACATWIRSQASGQRRVRWIVFGVDDAACKWVQTPSAERRVLETTVAQRTEDWGSTPGAVEALNEPESGGPGRVMTLTMHDAPARVLLDELDRRGLRWGGVCTLWHALSRVWLGETGGAVEAAVAVEGDRLWWVWARDGQLVAGGAARISTPGEDEDKNAPLAEACGRVALDWLTWSSYLGLDPERVRVIATEPSTMIAALGAAWKGAQAVGDPVDAPIGETLSRLASVQPDADDARTSLVGLTNRAGRGTRWRYRWIAACILGAASVAGAAGWRASEIGAAYRASADEIAQKQQDLLARAGLDNNPAALQAPTMFIRSQIASAGQSDEDFVEPDDPRPFFEEIQRLSRVVASVDDAYLSMMDLSDARCTLRVDVPDIPTGERLVEFLQQSDGLVEWNQQSGVRNNRIQLEGIWTIDEDGR